MTDRWQEINRLYDAALEVAEARPAFLESSCQGDDELRREVESLLVYDHRAQQLLDRPAMQMAAEKLAGEPRSLVGRKLGPYQIQVVLGAGGMGEVYKAKDTRLNRTVAIKVLPRLLSERAELRQRFEREARAIASLNHSNICALYDIGSQDGIDFLVMEYLEGETLSKRLKKGPLPTEQLLRSAIEIATALDQAHRHGVTHRDLKPGNIMLTKTGAKLLDFGLAKQAGGAGAPRTLIDAHGGTAVPHTRPTESESLTEEGMILGTLQYMAPEQVEGKAADSRTDIFAFGVVLYEMATGRRAFQGESNAGLTAAILTSQPPAISSLQPLTPAAFDRLVKRCLEKDPDERWQSIRDLTSELKWIAEAGQISGTPTDASLAGLQTVPKGWRREQLAWGLAVTFLIAAIASTVSFLHVARAPVPAVISEIPPPEKTQFNFQARPPVLSPDGRTLAFSAEDANGKTMLWIRPLDSTSARLLPGTEGGYSPFWSANGRALSFFADNKLKTVEAAGGSAVVVPDAPAGAAGNWNRDGTILFVHNKEKGLYHVMKLGGTPMLPFDLDAPKLGIQWPRFLPDGKHFLYHVWASDAALSGTYFASLDGKENRILLRGGARAIYASGFLLYVREATLLAQAFDPERGRLTGNPQLVAEQVAAPLGVGFFDASESGVLVYQRDGAGGEKRVRWFDRAGKELGVIGEASSYYDLRLSPDGTKLAFHAGDPYSDSWVEDLARGVPMRLTNEPGTDHNFFVWSPDGNRILFGVNRGKAQLGIYQKLSNGAGAEELLLPAATSDPQIWPTSWSRDGKFILYSRGDLFGLTKTNTEIWLLPLAKEGKPRPFVQTAIAADDGQFSPHGRWVAYTSRESGRDEVYAVPFEAAKVFSTGPKALTSPGGKWQISSSGGRWPRWRGDGKEIFYLGLDNQVMAAEVEARGNGLETRKAERLFGAAVAPAVGQPYDVTSDGKRFVINTVSDRNTPLTLVVNWTARLAKQ